MLFALYMLYAIPAGSTLNSISLIEQFRRSNSELGMNSDDELNKLDTPDAAKEIKLRDDWNKKLKRGHYKAMLLNIYYLKAYPEL